MNFKLNNFLSTLLFLKKSTSWWVKIQTIAPQCIYYFGSFASDCEAKHHQSGYVEDLVQEKTQGITVEIERCQPKLLMIYEEG